MTDYAAILRQHASPDVIAANPEYFDAEELSAAVSGGTTGHVSVDTGDTSAFSRKFEEMWAWMGGPDLETEFTFYTSRRWRFDYCHLPTQTAIELEGGIWGRGRHNRPAGFIADCEKYNAAARSGYSVFRLATGMVTPDNLQLIIDYINRKNEGNL